MLNIETHKNILVKILKDIYTDTALGPLLGFKGGTAALLFYGLPRFSVDLDFDLLSHSEDKMFKENAEDLVFEKTERIISQYGEIKTKRKKRFTLFFELFYSNADRNIKVEINRRNFGSKYEVANYFGISMNVMAKDDMFANKMLAMYERVERASRDIFDAWFFLQNDWPINKGLVEKRAEMPFGAFLEKCVEKLEKVPDRKILAGMGELLDAKQKVWVKANLKKEIIFLLKLKMEAAKSII